MRAKTDFSPAIKFAARSGFLTRDLWREFFANGKLRWQQEQWLQLKKQGFFLKHSSVVSREILVLNPHNRIVQSLTGGFRERPPYLAEVHHDETVIRGLLRLAKDRVITRFVLEKQLRRENEIDGSSKRMDLRKYPDSVIYLASGKKLAIEVELWQKSQSRYQKVFKQYAMARDLSEIIYICETPQIEKAIRRAATQFAVPVRFSPLSDWTTSQELIRRFLKMRI